MFIKRPAIESIGDISRCLFTSALLCLSDLVFKRKNDAFDAFVLRQLVTITDECPGEVLMCKTSISSSLI